MKEVATGFEKIIKSEITNSHSYSMPSPSQGQVECGGEGEQVDRSGQLLHQTG